MPDFWQFPTVSMGLGRSWPSTRRVLTATSSTRGLKPDNGGHVGVPGRWRVRRARDARAIGLAVREQLDNLIFVISRNLQRLDGPVRGNEIIQELERISRGAGGT